jgi:cytidylate kinase
VRRVERLASQGAKVMQIVCVSQGSLVRGREFAEVLAQKLGYDLLTRDEVLERAVDEGISVGRLETAIVKRRPMDERLMLEKELYQSFITRLLCERALEGNIVYAGRTGHLLLPGVTHILRVRVVTDMETRINSVMQRLRLTRERAKRYIEQVEDDRARWTRTMYAVDWDFSGFYDLVLNLEQVGVKNAATALCAYAQLPEFHETPASRRALEGLRLASEARLALARDKRTYAASLKVRANEGALSVTYLPKDAALAPVIPEVLAEVEGVRELRCALASTNVLWVQECFDADSPAFEALVQIAERWQAAVELLRVVPAEGCADGSGAAEVPGAGEEVAAASAPGPPALRREVDGGIEDDEVTRPSAPGCDDEGLRRVFQELNRRGIAGSMRSAMSHPRHVSLAIDRTVPYSLVVMGDIFVSRGHAVSQRLTRELSARIADTLRVPVIRGEDLKARYLVGPWQIATLAAYGVGILLAFLLVFTHQVEVLSLLTPQSTAGKVAAAAAVMVFIPAFAYFYGSFAKTLLKLARIE